MLQKLRCAIFSYKLLFIIMNYHNGIKVYSRTLRRISINLVYLYIFFQDFIALDGIELRFLNLNKFSLFPARID